MNHPDTGTVLTDYFGHTVEVGDTIVYPTKSGSSAAELSKARIEKIILLIKNLSGEWIREDHQSKAYPTTYYVRDDDASKAYILVVRTWNTWTADADGWSKKLSQIKNVHWCVVAP
jgi:hypothetical protein